MLDIVQRFAEYGYQIEPEALELIESYSGPRDELIERVMDSLDSSVAVVSVKHIGLPNFQPPAEGPTPPWDLSPSGGEVSPGVSPSGLLSSSGNEAEFYPVRPQGSRGIAVIGPKVPGDNFSKARYKDLSRGPSGDLSGTFVGDGRRPLPSCGGVPEVEVLAEITGSSTCVGEYNDFVRYFRDRYGKLRDLLSRRLNARPMESLGTSTAGREVNLIGMVMDIRNTAKGHRVVELEDPTGMITVIFQKDSPVHQEALQLVTDEVVGVSGVSDGGGRVFARSLIWPDLQVQSRPLEPGSGGTLLLSDLHVGSKYFIEEAWDRFISWVRGEVDDPSGLYSRVRYIVVAGDVVDGIGVYPGQEPDLAIKDIYEQYEAAGEYLSQIPSGIKVVISPGNHDMVRQAEPQPALPEIVQRYFSGSISFVGNPAWISLGGTPLLVYHGRSIDDLVMRIPGLSYREPEKAMVEMLRRRHLCPMYGNRVSIAPEREDHYVIERTPSILHCGHVHIMGITRYKGVTAINSGTWQGQTDFQKKMNIQPTPGIVPHVDLETMKVRKLIFA